MLQKAAARSDGLSGLSSGFEKLDKMTSGWQNSDLVIIAARPAMGKNGFRALHGQEDGGGHEDSGSHVLAWK